MEWPSLPPSLSPSLPHTIMSEEASQDHTPANISDEDSLLPVQSSAHHIPSRHGDNKMITEEVSCSSSGESEEIATVLVIFEGEREHKEFSTIHYPLLAKLEEPIKKCAKIGCSVVEEPAIYSVYNGIPLYYTHESIVDDSDRK